MDLVIFGIGGNCVDMLDIIQNMNEQSTGIRMKVVGFLDDDPEHHGTSIHGVPVLGPLAASLTLTDCCFVNGIGSSQNFRRKGEIISKARVPTEGFASLIDPSAVVSRSARMGPGTVIFPHVFIGANVRVGEHVMILPNAVISHDVEIGNYTTVGSGVCISGATTIEESCYLGTNSSIIQGVHLGRRCLVGMGAVVRHNVPEDSVVVGNPARTHSSSVPSTSL